VFAVIRVYVFLEANVRARCAFLSCLHALLLHLRELFNEQINENDDDDGDDDLLLFLRSLLHSSDRVRRQKNVPNREKFLLITWGP